VTISPPVPPDEEAVDFEAGALFAKFVLGVALLSAALLGLGTAYRGPLLALSDAYVRVFGGPGLALVWGLLDILPFPVFPQDVFMALSLLGGMGFWTTWAWSVLGSFVGGTVSFACGRWLGKHPRYVATTQRGNGKRIAGLIRRNRTLTLALCAVSPLPYSTGTWACGATGMPLGRFLLVSLLRGPRILFYLWLIQTGVIDLLS
jgi:uncharacterized membrane protein YdjX (TVP38/TMEM64 family)